MGSFNLIIAFIVLGFGLIYYDQHLKLKSKNEPKTKIIYRYMPRNPQDELALPVFPSDIFETMFTQPTPWITSQNYLDKKRTKNLNKNFISQI
jgi:hypothetical protein